MNTEFEAFEKLWAIKGHAEAVAAMIKLDGVTSAKLIILRDTVLRMHELARICVAEANK